MRVLRGRPPPPVPLVRRLRRLLLPIAVLLLALLVDRVAGGAWVTPANLLRLERGLFAAAFLLAWRLRRGRVAWAAALLGAVAETLPRLPAGVPSTEAVRAVIVLLLPLNLAVVASLREHTVVAWTGLTRFLALAAEALMVAACARPELAGLGVGLRRPLVGWRWLARLDLPQLAVAAFAAALLVTLVRALGRPRSVDGAWPGVVAASWLACERPESATFYFAAAALLLVIAVVEGAFSLAFEDTLTGLPGRRALDERLAELGARYTLAMVDIDHFKKLNDRYGHEVGDQVLRMVAARLAAVGGGGAAYRYGGEEFTLVLAGKAAAEARPHLEAVRASIAEHPFRVRSPGRPKEGPKSRGRGGGGKSLAVTVSLGAAEWTPRRGSAKQVLAAADRALYRAKRAGRNRLSIARS